MSQSERPSTDAHQRLGFRRKRQQVGRACDGCRLQRIKCDDSAPCLNCRTRGRDCSKSTISLVSTLPQAQDEIDKLKRRVKELEAELSRTRSSRTSPIVQAQEPTPPSSSPSLAQPVIQETAKIKPWDGVYLRPARSPHSAWFGPSSLYFFTHRLSTFLSTQAEHMLIHLASNLELREQPTVAQDSSRLLAPLTGTHDEAFYLTPIQEEYFLSLYWETYHTSLYAIIDEASFKTHVQSLYVNVPPGLPRKQSALLDIIIAMCMQYHISSRPAGKKTCIVEDNDATLAGRWYYRRAQTLLACEVESPSLSTLQCHLLCGVYVCVGSFHNMADSICSLAVRTAYMLGLHLEPPSTLPSCERELRRRLWWSVFELDAKVGIKVGRPFLVRTTHTMPQLPRDNLAAAIESGSTFAPIGDNATWLSFSLQRFKLYQTARKLNLSFYGYELKLKDGDSFYNDNEAMDDLALSWGPQTRALTEWTTQVPHPLKNKRKNGVAFSCDGSILDLEQYAPIWLQRQQLCLELEYNHLCISLHRPFISFSLHQGNNTIAMAVKCAQHAIELTNITHQALTMTTVLHGWHEAFQWQWSAAMTLVGFVMANTQHVLASAARRSIQLAVSVLDMFAPSFDAAAKAAIIVRTLHTNIESVMTQFEAQIDHIAGTINENPLLDRAIPSQEDIDEGVPNQFEGVGNDLDLLDMTMNVDFWAELDMLLPGGFGSNTVASSES
ncbi:hypothetical protein FVEN_g2919 [Fusarium venenatum]|uniref:Zn(2)-C6 fungal-type domain-containing protein n=2 Tax=Fusarium venenatum TaxID=56646 RepID=A0A2L2T2T3_9HYPO|nr:uncharacterized protein FVRRES_06299 [Fusarium venenatum]KAG8359494.1 hypothetical protein FVEN_g2919 [Fusarium venenatum]CEI61863.1 unnamed protein product [Fusarium venenatum]